MSEALQHDILRRLDAVESVARSALMNQTEPSPRVEVRTVSERLDEMDRRVDKLATAIDQLREQVAEWIAAASKQHQSALSAETGGLVDAVGIALAEASDEHRSAIAGLTVSVQRAVAGSPSDAARALISQHISRWAN